MRVMASRSSAVARRIRGSVTVLAQEPLDLFHQLAGLGHGQLLVVALLEGGDVGLGLVVVVDELVDLTLVGGGGDLEVGGDDALTEQLGRLLDQGEGGRSEEHTSELQSLM